MKVHLLSPSTDWGLLSVTANQRKILFVAPKAHTSRRVTTAGECYILALFLAPRPSTVHRIHVGPTRTSPGQYRITARLWLLNYNSCTYLLRFGKGGLNFLTCVAFYLVGGLVWPAETKMEAFCLTGFGRLCLFIFVFVVGLADPGHWMRHPAGWQMWAVWFISSSLRHECRCVGG